MKEGADPNALSADKWWTPLSVACFEGQKEIVSILLDNGADINFVDSMGNSPLLRAAFADHLDIVEELLQRGVDINNSNQHGMTALLSAVQSGDIDMAKTLIDAGADIITKNNRGKNILISATVRGDETMMDFLLADKDRADALVNLFDENNHYPLHFAVWQGNLKTVEKLVSHGADINCVNNRGETPLMNASAQGEDDMVSFFLRKRADINKSNRNDDTALALAVLGGKKKIVHALLMHDICHNRPDNSCFNKLNKQGESLLDLAHKRDQKDIVNILEDWDKQYDSLHYEFAKAQREDKARKQAEQRQKLKNHMRNRGPKH